MAVIETLAATRLVAIVRADDASHAQAAAETLIDSGFRAIEVALTTPDAVGVIGRLVAAAADSRVLVGGGTVLSAADTNAVAEVGGAFIVTPAIAPSLAEAAKIGLPSLAGAYTPSEILTAVDLGAAAVKLFPAEVGGPGYLSAIRAPLPWVKLIPVGGVTIELAPDYLKRGAFALGLGSPLLGDAVKGGDLGALRERATRFIAVAQDAAPVNLPQQPGTVA
jgi:2-dehydro-3-deoxyphosphogluconate aldolase/(4S)-4-hydroxy-2-oxoglutarate aldolase